MSFFLLLSKLFTLLLAPASWIMLLFIWRYFTINKRIKQKLFLLAVVLLLVFSNEFLFNTIVNYWQPPQPNLKGNTYQVGIVLGGFTSFDRFGKGYFNNSSDRFIQACKLYHTGTIKKVIVSGGSLWGDEPSEAGFVRNELIATGLKGQDVIQELRSRNTYENALFSKGILDSMGVSGQVMLITSAQHMKRATKLFEAAGVKVIGYPCDYRVINRKPRIDDYLLPKLEILDKWGYFFKELVGLAIYQFAGKA